MRGEGRGKRRKEEGGKRRKEGREKEKLFYTVWYCHQNKIDTDLFTISHTGPPLPLQQQYCGTFLSHTHFVLPTHEVFRCLQPDIGPSNGVDWPAVLDPVLVRATMRTWRQHHVPVLNLWKPHPNITVVHIKPNIFLGQQLCLHK